MIYLYCDGSFSDLDNIGGWACIAVRDDEEIWRISGKAHYTSSNRMELTAILKGLAKACCNEEVVVITDSQYSIDVLTATKPSQHSPNWDLIYGCRSLLQGRKTRRRITRANTGFEWVKSHSGNRWNTVVDHIANQIRKS